MTEFSNFLELVNCRRSVRGYLNKTVEREKIERCIEAARLAPSACNAQPWSFIIVDDPEIKNKIADKTSNTLLPLNHFTKQAPVHIVAIMEGANLTSKIGTKIRDKYFPMFDIGIAVEHICLQAVEEGLGTCIIGWFDEPAIKKILNIPLSKRVALIVTLGYPASDNLKSKKRKSIDSIMSYNSYKI